MDIGVFVQDRRMKQGEQEREKSDPEHAFMTQAHSHRMRSAPLHTHTLSESNGY